MHHIRKSLEDSLLLNLEIHPNKIIWADYPDWVLYSDNFLDLKEPTSLSTSDFLKILAKMDDTTTISVSEYKVEFAKFRKDHKYTIRYSLYKKQIDQDRLAKIEKIAALDCLTLEVGLDKGLLSILMDNFQGILKIACGETIYFTDSEETMVIPTTQAACPSTSSYEYNFETIRCVVTGLDKIDKIQFGIMLNGVGRLVLTGANTINYYLVIAELLDETD